MKERLKKQGTCSAQDSPCHICSQKGLSYGTLIGTALGLLIGMALDQTVNGMIIGFAVGMGVGGCLDAWKNK